LSFQFVAFYIENVEVFSVSCEDSSLTLHDEFCRINWQVWQEDALDLLSLFRRVQVVEISSFLVKGGRGLQLEQLDLPVEST